MWFLGAAAELAEDWPRDATMYVAERYGGLRLAEVAQEMGIRYQAAAQAVKRFGQALAVDPKREPSVSRPVSFETAFRSGPCH